MATTDDKKKRHFKDVEAVMCVRGKKADGSMSKRASGFTLSGRTLLSVVDLGNGTYKVVVTAVQDKPFPESQGL